MNLHKYFKLFGSSAEEETHIEVFENKVLREKRRSRVLKAVIKEEHRLKFLITVQ